LVGLRRSTLEARNDLLLQTGQWRFGVEEFGKLGVGVGGDGVARSG